MIANTRCGTARKDGWSRVALRLLALVAALVVVSGMPRARAAETAPQNIIFFGDSLTAGHGLQNPAEDAFPGRIEEKLEDADKPWRVIRAGLSGETTAGGLRRVDWILRQPVGIFVLALGGNDGLRGVDPAVSEANLAQIASRVRAKYPEARLVIAGMQMPPAMGEDYARRFAAMYQNVARKYDAAFVPFLLEGVAANPDLNLPDGIHPNAAGHRILAENVWKVLEPLL